MPRSKQIEHYFSVELAELLPDQPLPCAIHLYFPQNFHVVTWREAGDTITAEFIERYGSRGIRKVWIHNGDSERYKAYLAGTPLPPEDPAEAEARAIAAEQAAPAEPLPEAAAETKTETEAQAQAEPERAAKLTEEGTVISEVIHSPKYTEEEKHDLLTEAARALLARSTAPPDRASQNHADQHARAVVEDVLADIGGETSSLIAELWKLANVDPELEHSVNVATYTVIFSMAFGKIQPELISDLALAGLLHDVGLCRISASVTALPWNMMSAQAFGEYASHVAIGTELIDEFAPGIPERVKFILRQHHEKFDGTGYPGRIQGFQLDDVSQIVAMADLIDSIASGQWDGLKRSMMDTFQVVERIEKSKSFPQYFNPEIFSSIMKWIRSTEMQPMMGDAVKTVTEQARTLMQKPAA